MKLPISTCDSSGREVISSCRTLEGQTGPGYRSRNAWGCGQILLIPILFSLGVILGCAEVLTPMKPGAYDSVNPGEGLLLGRIHIMGSQGEQLVSTEEPFHARFQIQWRVSDQTLGKKFLVDSLPSNGPFVLKLPTGSYRLTAVSIVTALGIWQTSLPTSFTVEPRECTYLGTWELRTRAGFFDGSIVRQVFDQPRLAESDLKTFLDDGFSPRMLPQLSLAMESPVIMTFRTQGTELTSPP
jgi:hypothetical protein